mgnify:FL=1
MKIPPTFWTTTASRLTDVALAAVLSGLLREAEDLPLGVLRTGSAWDETRFAWVSAQVSAELAAAPGVAVDPAGGLAIIWDVAVAELPRGIGPATLWGRRIAATKASFARELAQVLKGRMVEPTRGAFEMALRKAGWPRITSTKPPERAAADSFTAELALAKQLERQLRARFPDVDDLGDRPSPADRRAFVMVLGAGYSGEQVLDALRGQAEKCAKNRRWRDVDAAQSFLRVSWLCGSVARLERAEQVGASLKQDPGGIVTGPAGTFAHGLEICTE